MVSTTVVVIIVIIVVIIIIVVFFFVFFRSDGNTPKVDSLTESGTGKIGPQDNPNNQDNIGNDIEFDSLPQNFKMHNITSNRFMNSDDNGSGILVTFCDSQVLDSGIDFTVDNGTSSNLRTITQVSTGMKCGYSSSLGLMIVSDTDPNIDTYDWRIIDAGNNNYQIVTSTDGKYLFFDQPSSPLSFTDVSTSLNTHFTFFKS